MQKSFLYRITKKYRYKTFPNGPNGLEKGGKILKYWIYEFLLQLLNK